jgi:hypothetical protein
MSTTDDNNTTLKRLRMVPGSTKKRALVEICGKQPRRSSSIGLKHLFPGKMQNQRWLLRLDYQTVWLSDYRLTTCNSYSICSQILFAFLKIIVYGCYFISSFWSVVLPVNISLSCIENVFIYLKLMFCMKSIDNNTILNKIKGTVSPKDATKLNQTVWLSRVV